GPGKIDPSVGEIVAHHAKMMCTHPGFSCFFGIEPNTTAFFTETLEIVTFIGYHVPERPAFHVMFDQPGYQVVTDRKNVCLDAKLVAPLVRLSGDRHDPHVFELV